MTRADSDTLQEVRILGLPLALHRRVIQHHAALRREFALLADTEPDDRAVPTHLLDLGAELTARLTGMTGDAGDQFASALARGAATVNLVLRLPPDAAETARRLDELLDEAEEHCRAGSHLLTLASPPEVLEYRRWLLGEFVSQLEGRPPTPWSAHLAAVKRRDGAAGDVAAVLPAELDLAGAPHVRAELMERVAAGAVDLRLDGSGVEFIDSVGVSVLMYVYARCAQAGGRVRISPASDRLRATLAGVGVDDLLLDDDDTAGEAST